jgi:hypothetical protein
MGFELCRRRRLPSAQPFVHPREPGSGPTTVIIASQDATHVIDQRYAQNIVGGGPDRQRRPPTSSAQRTSSTKVSICSLPNSAELTGSAVQADAPIAIIGGSTLMDVPLSVARADSAEQMLPPVRALGSEYVAARYRNRGTAEEIVPWRIVGVVDGTQLTYEPPQPNAPATVDAQQLLEFDEPGPFVVRSQDGGHPFYLAAYMTGGCGAPSPSIDADAATGPQCPNGPAFPVAIGTGPLDGNGDPEFLNVVPPPQYLPRYTFFTDPTYPETNLVVVRVRDGQTGQMPDVALDCAGVLTGWSPVGTSGVYEMTRIDLSTGDFQGVGLCDNGVHTIAATIPGAPTGSGAPGASGLRVTIWGWGNVKRPISPIADESRVDRRVANPKFTRWVSYGYPAGANFQPLNNVVLSAH